MIAKVITGIQCRNGVEVQKKASMPVVLRKYLRRAFVSGLLAAN